MAELVIECPPPDGHIEFSSTASSRNEQQTNSRIREFLKKHHESRSPSGSADSGNSSDDQQRQLANHSPPPNCSICLGRVKSKCFTDSCMHQFCFSCLLEWSKVKPECPLCKQTFKSIIHNVTSMDSYEEYKVEAQQRHVNWINLPFQAGDVDMNLLLTASLPTYYPDNVARTSDVTRRRLYQLFRHESPSIQRFAQTYPNEIFPSRINPHWRQYIYARRLYAEPLNDLGGQSRNISAEFYRANPAQMHRLMPWLHRELTCLNSDQPHPISYVMQRIETLIQTYDITSYEFQSRIRVLVANHTDHFIHELINYARSPYDLIGYDRFVTYSPRFETDTNDVVTVSSSEEGSDVEFVGAIQTETDARNTDTSNILPNQNNNDNTNNGLDNFCNNANDCVEQAGASTSGIIGATQTQTQTQTRTETISSPILSGDDSDEEEIKNYLRHKPNVSAEEVIRGRTGPSPNNANNMPSNSNANANANVNANELSEKIDFDSERTIIVAPNNPHSMEASTSQASNIVNVLQIIPKVEPNSQTKSPQEVIDADNASDSDECLFVCAKKPPHLRTPEYVELNSDSDSDVVFVSSETCQTPMTEITITNNTHLQSANNVRKSILSALTAQCSETSTNSKRKRGRNATDTSSPYTSQNVSSTYEAKPSTSETVLQWLIQSPSEHSHHISPKLDEKQHTPLVRPRLTTTIKISRGKRMYEPTTSEDSDRDESTDPESSSSSSSNSLNSSDVESSSHEEYVCTQHRTKRPANNDGASLQPRKKYRKRRGKRICENSSSEDSDADD